MNSESLWLDLEVNGQRHTPCGFAAENDAEHGQRRG